ncbi:MAG TPA: YggT family protein [Candidatus Thermoplasmatota archaeon]|nr:YggT family protein [Candidatus Thermoplasmatota archaeon]
MVIVCRLIQAYIIILFARIILSWFPIEPGGGMSTVYGFLYTLTEPVLGPIRRIIPPIGMGGMGLDLSPMIVTFGLVFLSGAIC